MTSVYQRATRLTAFQKRMRQFEEATYQILRRYERGALRPEKENEGVRVGQLKAELSTVFDAVTSAASRAFGKSPANREAKP